MQRRAVEHEADLLVTEAGVPRHGLLVVRLDEHVVGLLGGQVLVPNARMPSIGKAERARFPQQKGRKPD